MPELHETNGDEEGLNCDVWGEVDFGLGKIPVRCTRTGEHDEHICVVMLDEEE